jgi:hypothetical protein
MNENNPSMKAKLTRKILLAVLQGTLVICCRLIYFVGISSARVHSALNTADIIQICPVSPEGTIERYVTNEIAWLENIQRVERNR